VTHEYEPRCLFLISQRYFFFFTFTQLLKRVLLVYCVLFRGNSALCPAYGLPCNLSSIGDVEIKRTVQAAHRLHCSTFGYSSINTLDMQLQAFIFFLMWRWKFCYHMQFPALYSGYLRFVVELQTQSKLGTSCRNVMARHREADEGDDLQKWWITANILNKSRAAKKGWSSSM
jgi:hypothetical protein